MNYSINECVFRSSSPVQKSFTQSLIKCRCVSFSKTNKNTHTNTPPFRHSKECAFHQIRLILLKMRYENPFSINISKHTRLLGPFSVLQFPSNDSQESGRAPKGESKPNCSPPHHPRPQSPPQLGRLFLTSEFNISFEGNRTHEPSGHQWCRTSTKQTLPGTAEVVLPRPPTSQPHPMGTPA